jgi:TolB-like protein/Tfp pilus assembly protein PilF
MSGFFEEVSRRKVYRVAAAYAVAAGGIIQLASASFPAWELPLWSLRLVIAMLLMGFPIALIFAWVFDLTPEGLQRTERSETRIHRHSRRNIILLVAAGVLVSAAAGYYLFPRTGTVRIDKSIAVLPFDSFSSDQENSYFADGIHDDILTALARIADLKVISRTSVMQYRGTKNNLREIGKALGVETILEGSVRRDGNRVRVNVQLVNAHNDEHLWAENYEGELTDVFAIQRQLASKIAGTLHAKLSPQDQARLEQQPTRDPEAYLLYLQAQELFQKADALPGQLDRAEELYLRAIERDPSFTLATSRLSLLHSWRYHTDDRSLRRMERARATAMEALRRGADLPETHLALGLLYYWVDRDYEKALSELAIAKQGLPNSADTFLAVGAIERRQGKWQQSTVNLEKAASVGPKDSWVLENLAANYHALRRYDLAEQTIARALENEPNSASLVSVRAMAAVDARKDLAGAEQILARNFSGPDPKGVLTVAKANVAIWKRDYAQALATLDALREAALQNKDVRTERDTLLGTVYMLMGEEQKGRAVLEQARAAAEPAVQEYPLDPKRRIQLGYVLAWLGDKEGAIANGRRATEMRPISKDAFDGPMLLIGLAQIYALTGENEEAFALLRQSISMPNGVTTAMLELAPVWDGLRADPRFAELIAVKHTQT